MPLEIRPYQPADEEEVVAIWGKVFNYSAPHEDARLSIRKKMEFQPELFFVAAEKAVKTKGKVHGTVMAGYDGHRGWIYSLAVNPTSRRKGVGTSLIRHAEKALAALGCWKVNLTVLSTNAAVLGFYGKLGYLPEERIHLTKLIGN